MPSSVIAAMEYDAETRVLTMVYRVARGTYRYFDVPAAVWAAFQAAPSKGAYLNEVFKEMGFGYEQVEEADEPVAGISTTANGKLLHWPQTKKP